MFRLSRLVITSSNRFRALCNTAQDMAVKLLDLDNSIKIKQGLVLTISETNQKKRHTAQMLAVNMLFHQLEIEQVSKKSLELPLKFVYPKLSSHSTQTAHLICDLTFDSLLCNQLLKRMSKAA